MEGGHAHADASNAAGWWPFWQLVGPNTAVAVLQVVVVVVATRGELHTTTNSIIKHASRMSCKPLKNALPCQSSTALQQPRTHTPSHTAQHPPQVPLFVWPTAFNGLPRHTDR